MEVFSVNSEWKRSFVDMTAPDFILRRVVEFTDVTLCLDKQDKKDGKIHVYQDPVVYRCSLQTRILTKYDNLHSSMPSTTQIHTYCENLSLSLTDTQLPMFVRLIELMLALYYGHLTVMPTVTLTSPNEETPTAAERSGTDLLTCTESQCTLSFLLVTN